MEDSRASENDHQQLLIDRYLNSRSAYWSAQLAISGLLLTFFSADAVRSTPEAPLLHYGLVGVCIISIWLLLFNFRAVARFYFEVGSTTADDMPDVPESVRATARTMEDMRRLVAEHTAEWLQSELDRTHRERRALGVREGIIDGLLVTETVLVVLILFAQ